MYYLKTKQPFSCADTYLYLWSNGDRSLQRYNLTIERLHGHDILTSVIECHVVYPSK